MDLGEERDDCDVKTQMSVVEKPIFCSVSFSFKFCSYGQESNKENSNSSIFYNIRVTVSLNDAFNQIQKPVCLQFHFDKKVKL